MPSDRGTLPRTLAGGADQHPIWQEPTAPRARRLPGAPRERRPALAALAVLLILGGALGAGFLVIQSGKRVAAIEVSAPVGAGQPIPLSAMRQVQIAAGTGLGYVPWDEAAQVARFSAVSAIPPGTLLTRAMAAPAGASLAGKAVLGLALKDGQLPRGLADGDHIDIYQVSDAQETCPGTSGALLAAGAVVLSVAAPAATSGSSAQADVQVALNPADAGPVACNAANGAVGIAVLPAGGALSGPASSGPASSGPASSGPASSGPASSGPASSGPASSGPASSGPASSGAGGPAGRRRGHRGTAAGAIPGQSAAGSAPASPVASASTGSATPSPGGAG